jgi:hypothetical protein
MVVGYDQALIRNEFTGTTAAKEHNGILHRGLIDAVNIFCREFKSIFLHDPDIILIDKYRYPHPLVGSGSENPQCNTKNQQE